MNKNELLAALEATHEKFLDLIDDLSEETMIEPGVVGAWSIKDILAHLCHWEAEIIKLLWQARQGEKPTTDHFGSTSVDTLNAQWTVETHSRPLERVLADFHVIRNQTIHRVEAFSDQELSDPKRYPWLGGRALSEWVIGDSVDHENEHAGEIRSWLENRKSEQKPSEKPTQS